MKLSWHFVIKALVISGVLCLGLVTVQGSRNFLRNLQTAEVQTGAALEDYYMEGVQFRQFNREGKLHCIVAARELTHQPRKNQFFFVAPKIILNDPSGKKNWEITARRGRSEGGKDKIFLADHVKLVKHADENYPKLVVTTESLIFDTVLRLACSSEKVMLKEGANSTSAVGAELDLNAKQVKLLSQIFSTYHFEE